ncbi:MAG: 23S rRNA (uracil(1939)-C(5))-methyltransferase RlmD [Limosilactobacillus sp.]|jgi:23S rRNA (uracil-5-)-methyltransferase RumA|uniref:23S rRNA (uracil(1939)-C(5))-methyltransferase RlmD n=1 Tax=Limosilactobacillus sp. TaxID=2773925 RepID=UPI0025BFDA6E|nr:23S rRNA (uracil(1939)-C(5))-methyltransferase RlmD [Limosilactobacillus sp.]MCI1974771.1 23S rRNA (uracil(1939)-C(5))-methyltransferase RlmD [Limosilactobacillus sp.]MCI2030968.1 23S rRNA (uracil(1939)-C(5))-methyltransferase RlmD [Limosilactobacillus sp.]
MVQARSRQHDIEVQVGDRFPLTIRRLGVNGQGIGYFKHKVCFVPGALPHEVVVAEVTRVHPRFLEAKIHRLRKASRDRVEPRDDYADVAGGFELEKLAYPAQLRFKRQVILDSLEKFKPYGYRAYAVRPTIAAPQEYGYRNKATFQVRIVDGHVAAGLYRAGSHDLVDIETCAVQMPATMKVIRTLVQLIEDLQIPVYDEEHNSGIIKTLVVRESVATGEIQLTLITNTPKLPHKHQLLMAIDEKLPKVVSVMQNVNPGDTPLVWGDKMIHLAGQEYITESLMGLDFKLSARSFLQLNPAQTETLYEEAAKALELSPDDVLIDAYAGIGTIGLSLANQVKEVWGMETIPEAVNDAKQNASLNGITNAYYEVGSAEEVLPQWRKNGLRFDALVVDPPRTGLDNDLIEQIIKERPAKFAYVSCNMASLARNLGRLASVYHVDYIQPVDMMPQTTRCEAVIKLSLRK